MHKLLTVIAKQIIQGIENPIYYVSKKIQHMTYKFSYQILYHEREKEHNQQHQKSFKKTKNNQCSNNARTN